jgi:hypothetical protein
MMVVGFRKQTLCVSVTNPDHARTAENPALGSKNQLISGGIGDVRFRRFHFRLREQNNVKRIYPYSC